MRRRSDSCRYVKKIYFNVFLLWLMVSSPELLASTTIVTQNTERQKEKYSIELLKLALSYSGKRYNFEELNQTITQARQIEEVKSGNLDVTWLGTSEVLEEDMRAVPIPLYKGLLGHRIFIIRQGDQEIFDKINTFDQLKEVRLGQGKTWTDTQILKSSGLNVVTAVKFDSLFYMLEGSRFDAFPRGVHEPWVEVESRRQLNLTIENRLILVYRYPLFFFVHKDNRVLANDIYQGLIKAHEDGSFDKHFYNHPLIKSALDKTNMIQRVVFTIDNPTLTRAAKAVPEKYWLNMSDIKR